MIQKICDGKRKKGELSNDVKEMGLKRPGKLVGFEQLL